MSRSSPKQGVRTAVELVEEAVHLLRHADAGTWMVFCAGSLPFALGLLYFWSEMSHSGFAWQHEATATLGMTLLFVWLKCWQSVFVGRLRAQVSGHGDAQWSPRRVLRLVAVQTTVQSTGLFLLPLAAAATLPFVWVFSFYQNVSYTGNGSTADVREIARASFRLAKPWAGQNHLLLGILSLAGLAMAINWISAFIVVPMLAKSILGIESAFTRSSSAYLNTTFFAVVGVLSWLCVDPLVKACYVLRCFYAESVATGADLLSSLRAGRASALLLATAVLLLGAAEQRAAGIFPAENPSKVGNRSMVAEPIEKANPTPAGQGSGRNKTEIEEGKTPNRQRPESEFRLQPPGDERAARSSPVVGPAELDRSIRDVINQREYVWRIPRDSVPQPPKESDSTLYNFFDDLARSLGDALKYIGRGIGSGLETVGRWLDKLLGNRLRAPKPDGSNLQADWLSPLRVLVILLLVALLAVIGVLAYRAWKRHRARARPAVSTEALPAVPDLRDENVAASDLPQDGWLQLARDLLSQGELRLALRALYLASLASLAEKELVSIAKFKSNRDYERELRRRAHALPEVVTLFHDNVLTFDRVWYGLHEVSHEMLAEFESRVERIRGAV